MTKSIMPHSTCTSVDEQLERSHHSHALVINWFLLRSYIFMRYCTFFFFVSATARSEELPSPSSYDSGADNDQLEPRLEEITIHGESPQVTIDVQSDGDAGHGAQVQCTTIARIVSQKDFISLQDFGGIHAFTFALDTHSETGLSGAKEHRACKEQTPSQSFSYFIKKACCNYIILLLLLSAALSLGFGIKEEGLNTGWYEGVIIVNVIIILVVVPSTHHYWHAHSKQLPWRQELLEERNTMVDVIRSGQERQISMSDVLLGDIVLLNKGHQVPADGLFVRGEFIELDNGLQPIVDHRNPFLFHGAKVTNGSGRMLVTSLAMNRVLGQVKKTKLHAQLDRVSSQTQIIALIVYIVILVMLFLRFTLRNKDHESDLPDFRGKSTPIKQLMDAVMKPRGKMSLLTSLTILLAGIVEGLPLMVTLATVYWNKKALHGKGTAQELTACVMMGSVTTICIDKIGGVTKNDVHAFRNAGVDIKLISGDDDVPMLETIGQECGMMMPDSDKLVIRGEEFRNSTHAERMEMADKISVMGNAIPSDRLILMECLKEKGHTMAVVGVGTEEAQALREADVGITMGNWSTNLGRESSDIIIWDGDLGYLLVILGYGRCIYDNIQKYIQLELTVIIAGWLTNSIMAISSGYTSITPFQMCWVNMVVGILGGLALLTEPPTKKQMEKRPTEPFITKEMWGNIITQVSYQTAVLIAFQFRGQAGLGITEKVSNTMMFNIFLICQVFNLFNARARGEENVLRGIQQNLWFWVAVGVIVTLQTAFIEIAHKLVGDERLNFMQWLICTVIGMGSWVIALAEKWASSFITYWIDTFCI